MSHTHTHTHDYSKRSHPEYVVLDIGDRYGALIARDGRHKQVLERSVGDRSAYTLVFDRLAEGSYSLWLGDDALATDVPVCAAEVTELDWRGAT